MEVSAMEKALIICTPGLEKELFQELQEIWPALLSPQAQPQTEPLPKVEFIKGGIEIQCDLFRALQLNFFLKLATRVLFRLDEFKCRDFPKLYQHLKRIPWNQWLGGDNVQFHISAAESRLNNEKRIEEILKEVLMESHLPANAPQEASIYIRNFKDVVTVSLDLSGEPLYKRILQKKVGDAPFRESWASFVLRRMIKDRPLAELAGIDLVDPFAGSGTFLLESLTYGIPNFKRSYSGLSLVRTPKLFKSPTFTLNYKKSSPHGPLFHSFIGGDLDPKMISAATENLLQYESHFKVNREAVQFYCQDAFSPQHRPAGPVWLITNPPWGTRLPQNMKFPELARALVKAWSPKKMALVVPHNALSASALSDYQLSEKINLVLGGQGVDLVIFNQK
jgi:putative N6-adenine-specific DNA methylase